MKRKSQWFIALFGAAAIGTGAVGLVRHDVSAFQDDADTAAKITSAVSAAPPAISDGATVVDNARDAAGKFIVLREGSNGWTCFPDRPASPGPDPKCFDAAYMDWAYAIANKKEPNKEAAGLAYMLQGGSDASNTDPFATEPAAGEDWVNSPAHVMILLPGPIDQKAFSTDHHSGQPFIMWAGTPYEHIMMPVAAEPAS